jgi:hypothetical protein
MTRNRQMALIAFLQARLSLRRNDIGTGRLFSDQTYHHAVLRALNQVVTHGADISEVQQAITHIRAGDEQNWHAEWTALGDRNMARARSVRNRQSRGEALLRAHTYYARAQFYLSPNDPKRPATYDLCRSVFYEGSIRSASSTKHSTFRTAKIISRRSTIPPRSQSLDRSSFSTAATTRSWRTLFFPCGLGHCARVLGSHV